MYRDEYECLPQNDPQGILQLEPGPDVKGVVVVEATLRVVRHPRLVVGLVDVDATLRVIPHPRIVGRPVDAKAFTEYRLVDAKLAGP